MDDSPFSCPQCGCQEAAWAAEWCGGVMCSCRACGWEYLLDKEAMNGCEEECGSEA